MILCKNDFNVTNLAWNKTDTGSDKYALGTFNKFLYVFNINNHK